MEKNQKDKIRERKNSKGITLIALVITIVVLLILAGVAIATLTGDNGILTKTNDAKVGTKRGEVEEAIDLILTEYQMKKHSEAEMLDRFLAEKVVKGEIDEVTEQKTEETLTGYIVKKDGYQVEVSLGGVRQGSATKVGEGDNDDDTVGTIEAGETAVGGNKEYTDTVSGKTAVIPKGFTVSDREGETNINQGLVVIGPDGSEFVWIPVDTPSEMYGTDSSDKKWGKLYDFSYDGSSSSALNWEEENGTMSITDAEYDYREPDIVSDYDNDTEYLNTINGILRTTYSSSSAFLTDMELEFNSMIESIEANKGFYVGRYETSLNSSKVAQSVSGVLSSHACSEDTESWYGLYARQKLYNTDSVQGSMIWGCQYDAMMRWMQSRNIDVTTSSPTDVTGESRSYNESFYTGVNSITDENGTGYGSEWSDKLCNIYDLLGNKYEWTLEACGTYSRASRGGSCNNICYPSDRSDYGPSGTNAFCGSRLSLYIKP